MSSGKIVKISGPLVVATGLSDANMADVVRVGEQRLIGEILTMNGDSASIQVYEETSGLGPGAAVETTGSPLSVELGPGLIENIYDGIQRPLEGIMKIAGSTITRGIEVPALDRQKHWDFQATAKPGDKVEGGDVIGTVQETSSVLHKIMIPPKMSGTLETIQSGSFTVLDTVATLRLDAVAASGFSMSRSKMADLISSKKLMLNGRECDKPDRPVGEGDVLVCRGLGKCVLSTISGPSKKGRIMIVIERYI